MSNIFVTNNSDQDLHDGYGGVFYDFKIGSTVEIPENVAQHIFGYGDENKEKYLVQLGLMRLHSELEEATEKFQKVTFSETAPSKGSSLPSAVGVVPLRIEKSVGGKSNQRVA